MRAALPIALIMLLAAAWLLRGGMSPIAVGPEADAPAAAGAGPAELDRPGRSAEGRVPSVPPAALEPTPGEAPSTHGLELHVVEAATGAPTSSRVTLWRLGLPAQDGWLPGDQLWKVVEVPAQGLLLEHVNAGRYRAVLHAAVADAEDPPEFEVRGGLTRVYLALQRPASHRTLVRLYDVDGLRLTRVERKTEYYEWQSLTPEQPAWATRRRVVDPSDPVEDGDEPPEEEGDLIDEEIGERMSSDADRWHWIDDPGQGFDFGAQTDDGRGTSQANGYLFRHDQALGYGHVGGTPGRDRAYVGVLADPSLYLDLIMLPDGRYGFDIPEHVTVTSGLLLVDEDAIEDPWHLVTIEVRVRHPEFKHLTFTHRLADPWPRRYSLAPTER